MSNELQNKFLHYEVQPPEGVWNKIAASLDETIPLSASEKLYQFETNPPASVWQNISAQLNNTVLEKVKVVPFFTRYRRPLKYSGAIAAFIFLAVITSLFISKKTESEVPVDRIVNNHAAARKDSAKNNAPKENNSVSQIIEKNNSAPIVVKSKTSKTRFDDNEHFTSLNENPSEETEQVHAIAASYNSDKYMIYTDGDGNDVRLPKKIFNAFACPINNTDCKQRLQKLREKFAESAMTTDFTGLLQILKSLQENQ